MRSAVIRATLAGMAVLATATAAAADAAREDADSTLRVVAPDGSWTMSIELPGFELGPVRRSEGGSPTRRRAVHMDNGLVVTASIEAVPGATDAGTCRKRHWGDVKRSTEGPVSIHDDQRGAMAIRWFKIRERRGVRVDQRIVLAYLHRDAHCAIVHLSKPSYVKDDAALFDAVLDSIRIAAR